MNRELIPQMEPMVERLRSWVGALVRVSEEVTRLAGNYDRHFATSTVLVFRLRHVGVALSGGALGLLGDLAGFPFQYEATVEMLDSMAIGQREIVLVERFGATTERRSTIALIDVQTAEGTSTEVISQ